MGPVMPHFKKLDLAILVVLAVIAAGAVQGDVWAAEPEGAVADSRQDCSEEKPQAPPDWLPKLPGAQYDNIYQNMPPFHSPYEGANSLTFRNGPGQQATQVYGVYFGSQLARGCGRMQTASLFREQGQGSCRGIQPSFTAELLKAVEGERRAILCLSIAVRVKRSRQRFEWLS